MKVVCIESNEDIATQLVAEWRTNNTHSLIKNSGFGISVLQNNLAARNYLANELLDPEVVFLTGSGHGLYDEFHGSDGLAVLEVNKYNQKEVTDKIIHLLSCSTAFRLGIDVVRNGCLAFFGYDLPFSYHRDYVDSFMQPDHALVEAIVNRMTAKQVHEAVINKYNEMIETLEEMHVNPYVVSDMKTNRDHFCSPAINPWWGKTNATLPASVF